MRSLLNHFASIASAGAFFLLACAGGTGEGNPEFGLLSVSLRAQNSSSIPLAKKASTDGALIEAEGHDTLVLYDDDNVLYYIHHIYAHIDQIEFARPKESACRSNDSVACTDTSVVISTHRYVDLLEKPSPLILRDFPLPLGIYTRMKVRFSKLADLGGDSIPPEYAPLIGHSIMMKGSFPYKEIPNRDLTIFIAVNDAFDFNNAQGLAITRDLSYSWSGVFVASQWLKRLEIAECLDKNQIALKPDGSIVIDEQSDCNELEDSLVENVRNSTHFEESDAHELDH